MLSLTLEALNTLTTCLARTRLYKVRCKGGWTVVSILPVNDDMRLH